MGFQSSLLFIPCVSDVGALSFKHFSGHQFNFLCLFKAANILLSTTGQVKLADFGVAGQLQSLRISKTHTTVGTPNWMAPEVILGSGHDGKADIWSLGITAIELATGRVPHGGKPPMQVFKLIPTAPAPVLQGEYSDELKDFVARCLKKNPRERPSAADLLGHPFIASVENSAVLEVLVKESKVIREQDKERKEDGGKKRGKKQQGQAKGNGLGLGVDRKAEPRLAEPPLPSPAQPLRPPLPTTLQPALQSNEHSHSAQRRVATAPPARSSLARSPDRALKSVRILLPDDASSGSGSATSGSSRSAASRENFTWSTQGDASNLNAGETDRFFDAIGMVRPWARTSTHPVLDSLEHVLDKLKGADPGLYGRLLGSLGLPSNVPSSTKPPEGSYMYRRWRDKVRRRETVVDNH